jgi:hypothetical protein
MKHKKGKIVNTQAPSWLSLPLASRGHTQLHLPRLRSPCRCCHRRHLRPVRGKDVLHEGRRKRSKLVHHDALLPSPLVSVAGVGRRARSSSHRRSPLLRRRATAHRAPAAASEPEHLISERALATIDFPTTYFWKAWLRAYLHISISVLRLPHGVSGLCYLLTCHATLWLAAGVAASILF